MKLKKLSTRWICSGVIALALMLTTSMFGQGVTTSGLTGFVTDKAGKPIEGATVTVVLDASGGRYVATTGSTGRYNLSGLITGGPYTVTATAPNLPPAEKKDVYTSLGATGSIDLEMSSDVVQLEAYKVSESADNSTFGAQAMGTGSSYSSKQIMAVSSIRRDLQDFQNLDPRAVVMQVSPSDPAYTFSIAGQNPRENALLVDGVSAADNFGLNSNGYAGLRNPVPLEWIAAATLEVSPYDVIYSGFLGGITDVSLKSGTNEFHGSAYEVYTGTRMRGPDPVVGLIGPHEPTNQHTTGATLGGPIIPNKLFFFVGYEVPPDCGGPRPGLQPPVERDGNDPGAADRVGPRGRLHDRRQDLHLQPGHARRHQPHLGAELRRQDRLEHLRLPEVHLHVPPHEGRCARVLQLHGSHRDLV
jgi:hypothetical protein